MRSSVWVKRSAAIISVLGSLLAAAILTIVLIWHRDPSRHRLLWSAALLTGLSLTNQQTVVFYALSLLISLLFIALFFVLARNLLKLFAERRLGVLGS